MRITLIAVLLVIATIIVFLPAANALIPRMDFNGNHNINHIVVSQLNPDVKILRAWLNPDWQASKTLYRVTLDSSLASLVSGQTVNMVIMTDGKPAFSLDTLATR